MKKPPDFKFKYNINKYPHQNKYLDGHIALKKAMIEKCQNIC